MLEFRRWLTEADESVGFYNAMKASPKDGLPHLAFADWLDEHGRPDEAIFHRRFGGGKPVVFPSGVFDGRQVDYADVSVRQNLFRSWESSLIARTLDNQRPFPIMAEFDADVIPNIGLGDKLVEVSKAYNAGDPQPMLDWMKAYLDNSPEYVRKAFPHIAGTPDRVRQHLGICTGEFNRFLQALQLPAFPMPWR